MWFFLQRILIALLFMALLSPPPASFALAPKTVFKQPKKPKAVDKEPPSPALKQRLDNTGHSAEALSWYMRLGKIYMDRKLPEGISFKLDKTPLEPEPRVLLIEAILGSNVPFAELSKAAKRDDFFSAAFNFLQRGFPVNTITFPLISHEGWREAFNRLLERKPSKPPQALIKTDFANELEKVMSSPETAKETLRHLRNETFANARRIKTAMDLLADPDWVEKLETGESRDLLDFSAQVVLGEEIKQGKISPEMYGEILNRLASEPRLGIRMAFLVLEHMRAEGDAFDAAWHKTTLKALEAPASLLPLMTDECKLSPSQIKKARDFIQQNRWEEKIAAGDQDTFLDVMFEVRQKNPRIQLAASRLQANQPRLSAREAYQAAQKALEIKRQQLREKTPAKATQVAAAAGKPLPQAAVNRVGAPPASTSPSADPVIIVRKASAKQSEPSIPTPAAPIISLEARIKTRRDVTKETYNEALKTIKLMDMGMSENHAKSCLRHFPRAILLNPDNEFALNILIRHLKAHQIGDFLKRPDFKECALLLQHLVDRDVRPLNAKRLALAQGGTPDAKFTTQELEFLISVTLAVQDSMKNGKFPTMMTFASADEKALSQSDLTKLKNRFPGLLDHDAETDVWITPWVGSEKSGHVAHNAQQLLLCQEGVFRKPPRFVVAEKIQDQFGKKLEDPAYQQALRDKMQNITAELERGTLFFFDAFGRPLAFYDDSFGHALDVFTEFLLRKEGVAWMSGLKLYENGRLINIFGHLSRVDLPEPGLSPDIPKPGKLAVKLTRVKGMKTLDSDFLTAADFETVRAATKGTTSLDEQLAIARPEQGHAKRRMLTMEKDGTRKPFVALSDEVMQEGNWIWEWLRDAQGGALHIEEVRPSPTGIMFLLFSGDLGKRWGFDHNRKMEWSMTPKTNGIEVRVRYHKTQEDPEPPIFLLNIPVPKGITSTYPVFRDATEPLNENEGTLCGGKVLDWTSKEQIEIPKMMVNAKWFTQKQWDDAVAEELAKQPSQEQQLADLIALNGGDLSATIKQSFEDEKDPSPLIFFLDEEARPFDFIKAGPYSAAFETRLKKHLADGKAVWVLGLKLRDTGDLEKTKLGRDLRYGKTFGEDRYVAMRIEKRPDLVTKTVSLHGAQAYIKSGVIGPHVKVVSSILAYLVKEGGDAPSSTLIEADPIKIEAADLRRSLEGLEGDYLLLQGIYAGRNKNPVVVVSGAPKFRFPAKFSEDGRHWMEARVRLQDFVVDEGAPNAFRDMPGWINDRKQESALSAQAAMTGIPADGLLATSIKELAQRQRNHPYGPEDWELLKQIGIAAQEASRAKKYQTVLTLPSEEAWLRAKDLLTALAGEHPEFIFDLSASHPIIVPEWMRDIQGKPLQRVPKVILDYPDAPYRFKGLTMTAAEEAAMDKKISEMSATVGTLTAAQRKDGMTQRKGHYFFDKTGRLLAWHEGFHTLEFNQLLEMLLRDHEAVWVLGMPVAGRRYLPETAFHVVRRHLLVNDTSLQLKPNDHLALQFIKGHQGRGMEQQVMTAEDFEAALAGAETRKEPLDEIITPSFQADHGKLNVPLAETENNGAYEPLTPDPLEIRDSTWVWELLKESGGLPVRTTHHRTYPNGRFSFLFSETVPSKSGFEKDWPVVWKLSPKKNGIEISMRYLPKDGEKPAKRYLFNIRFPESFTAKHPYFLGQREELSWDEKALQGGRIVEPDPENIPHIAKDMLDAKLINEEEYQSLATWKATDEPMKRLQGILEPYKGSHVEAAKPPEQGGIKKGIIFFYTETGEAFDFHLGSNYGPDFEGKVAAALKKHGSFWMGGMRLKKGKVLQSLPLGMGTVSYDDNRLHEGDPVSLLIQKSPAGKPLIEKTVAFRDFQNYVQTKDGSGLVVIPSVRAYLVKDGTRTLIAARPTRLHAKNIEENMGGLTGSHIELLGIAGTNNASKKTAYLTGRPEHPFGDKAAGKPLRILLDPADLSVSSFDILPEYHLAPRPPSGLGPPPDSRQRWEGRESVIFGVDPFGHMAQSAGGVSELSDRRWAKKGGPRPDTSRPHVRNGNGYSLDAMSVRDRVEFMTDMHRWPYSAASYLSRKEPFSLHFEFLKGLLDYYDMSIEKALRLHAAMPADVFRDSDAMHGAVEALDPHHKKGFAEKLLNNDARAWAGMLIDVFRHDIPNDKGIKNAIRRILLKERRHGVPMAVKIVMAMKKENLPYEKIWRALYLQDMGWAWPAALEAQGLFTPEMLLGPQAPRLKFLLDQKVQPTYASLLLQKEGETPYTSDELKLLAKVTRIIQNTRASGKETVIVRFPPDELPEALGMLTDLAEEHPDPKQPSLLRFDKAKRVFWTRWMVTSQYPKPPKVYLKIQRTWPGYLLPSLPREELVSRILKKDPRHSPEMAEAIVDFMQERQMPYWPAWVMVYLNALGMPEEKMQTNRGGIPASILINKDNHAWLKILLKHLSPPMARRLAQAADPESKTMALDKLIAAGVSPFTARQLMLQEGNISLDADDLELLCQVALKAQAAVARKDNRQVLKFSTEAERDAALARLSALAERLGMDVDRQQGLAVPHWVLDKKGYAWPMPPRVILSTTDLPALGPSVLLSAKEKGQIEENLSKQTFADNPEERLRLFKDRKSENRRVYCFDDQGKLLAVHAGDINTQFNSLLEALLQKHGVVWVEGVSLPDNKQLPDNSPHFARRGAIAGVDKPFMKSARHLAVRFTKGYFGNSLDVDFLSVEDFETLLKPDDSAPLSLSQKAAKHAPKQGLHAQNLAYVQTPEGLQPLVTVPDEFKEGLTVWSLFAKAGGRPIVMTHRMTTGNAKFPFLLAGDNGKRNVRHAGRPARWQMSAVKDGFEFRVTYLNKDGTMDASRPEIHLFNVKLPDALTGNHPYFRNAPRYLLKDTEGMKGVNINWASQDVEMPVIRDGLIEAGIFTHDEWMLADKAASTMDAAARLAALLRDYHDAVPEAARSSKGLTVFYDKAGKLKDFFQGSQYKRQTRTIWQEMLDAGEEFWVGGLVLENRGSLQGLPDLGWVSYDKLGFPQGSVVALRIRINPQGKPMILQTVLMEQRMGAGERLPGDGKSVDSVGVDLIRKASSGTEDKIFLASHPNKVSLEQVIGAMPPLQKGDYLLLENVLLPPSGAAKPFLTGMKPHRFSDKNLWGKRVRIKLDPKTFGLIGKPEIMQAGREGMDMRASGIAMLVPPEAEPQVLYNFSGSVLERLKAGEGAQSAPSAADGITPEQRVHLIAGLEKLAADHPDLAGDYLARKDFWIVKDLPRLALHPEGDSVVALEESAAGHADLVALKAYHEMLHEMMESQNPYLEEILVKKRELEYLFGGAFGAADGERIARLLEYLRRNDRVQEGMFLRLAEDYRDLTSGKPGPENTAAVYALIASYVNQTGDAALLADQVNPSDPLIAGQLPFMERWLNMRLAMKQKPSGMLTNAEMQAQADALLGFPRGHVGDELANHGLNALAMNLEFFDQDFGDYLKAPGSRDTLQEAIKQANALMGLQNQEYDPLELAWRKRKAPANSFIALNRQWLETVRAMLQGNARIEARTEGTGQNAKTIYTLQKDAAGIDFANILKRIAHDLPQSESVPDNWVVEWDKLRKIIQNLQATLNIFELQAKEGEETNLPELLEALWVFLEHNRGFISQIKAGEKTCPEDIPPALGSPAALQQILLSAFYLAGHSAPDQPGAKMHVLAKPLEDGKIMLKIQVQGGAGLSYKQMDDIREELRWKTMERMMQSLGGSISYATHGGKSATVTIIFATAQKPAPLSPVDAPEPSSLSL